jgi:hypothetical protein
MEVKRGGMLILIIPLAANAPYPILVIVSGKLTVSKRHSEKAWLPIEVTLLGILT